MSATQTAVPTLAEGDRMDREEFHRRYLLRPDLHHVELIEGVVCFMPMPISWKDHADPQTFMITWVGVYRSRHDDVVGGVSASVFLDGRNQPEPDALLFRQDRKLITADGYIGGAPDLVVEVANSSVSRDLREKKDAYERNGVREYIVWRVQDYAIDWFQLRNGRFERREPGEDGVIESDVFPGLRLNVTKALEGDLAGVLAEVR